MLRDWRRGAALVLRSPVLTETDQRASSAAARWTSICTFADISDEASGALSGSGLGLTISRTAPLVRSPSKVSNESSGELSSEDVSRIVSPLFGSGGRSTPLQTAANLVRLTSLIFPSEVGRN